MTKGSCEWREDEDGNWWSSCDNGFVFDSGAPSENGFRFCPYCGRVLWQVQFSEVAADASLHDCD